MTALRRGLEVAAFGTLLGLARIAPRGLWMRLGAAAGRLGFALDRRHRSITLSNLDRALGDTLERDEILRIARRCWAHFGRITLNALQFPRLSAASLGDAVRIEGEQHLRRAYEDGRGVLVYSAHYGHWELTALMQGYLGLRLSLVTRPLDNPRLESMLARLRCASGNRIIHKRDAVREMLRTLRSGGGVAILIDQDARESGVFVPYFGRPASTTPTLASLALRTGASVLPVFSVPQPDGSLHITYEPPISIEPSGDPEADVVRLTAACTAVIERWVRRHPELWLWMHRRWKTPAPEVGDGGPTGDHPDRPDRVP